MPNIGPLEVFALLLLVAVSVPAYVVGQRRDVPNSGLAFIPFVGPWIVILRSIRTSAWLTILACIPFVSLVFGIWAAFTVPIRHSRTAWWGVAFIIPFVNFVGFWVYAFTLPTGRPDPTRAWSISEERLARINTLADLRDRGALSEEEFKAEKARLLTVD